MYAPPMLWELLSANLLPVALHAMLRPFSVLLALASLTLLQLVDLRANHAPTLSQMAQQHVHLVLVARPVILYVFYFLFMRVTLAHSDTTGLYLQCCN